MRRTILILSSMPRDTVPLRVHEEIREIEDAIRRSRYRDEYQVVSRLGVRARDLHRVLLEHRPAIVHFAGHGYGERGVALEDDRGDCLLVSGSHLAEMLGHFKQEIECVVLNACDSEVQIGEIAEHIPSVIGMSEALDDRAALSFAIAFYDSVANGESIASAHAVACSAVSVNGLAFARIASLATGRAPAAHFPSESGERSSDAISASQDEVPSPAAGSIRDEVCRVLPKLLAPLSDDPLPIVIRAGLPRDVCRGDSARNKWTYVCAWLVEQPLWGLVYTLRIVAEIQEERFSYELSRWAANYIRLLSSKHDGPGGERAVARGLGEILSFAHHERDRWDEFVRVLEKQVGTRSVSEQSMTFVAAYRNVWADFAAALAGPILQTVKQPNSAARAVKGKPEKDGVLRATRGKAG